jgi:hypothetical protein
VPAAMGQPIAVVRKPTPKPDLLRFEINRSLTGMGHERYGSAAIQGDRPPDELARRLFGAGGVRSVHIYSNVIDVEVDDPSKAGEYEQAIRDLYIHYKPGVTPSFP